MAFEQDIIEERFGSFMPGAYVKLCYISWSDQDKRLMATFSIWASPTAEAEGKEAISVKPYDITSLFPELQGDIYKHLKKNPDFAGSKDV